MRHNSLVVVATMALVVACGATTGGGGSEPTDFGKGCNRDSECSTGRCLERFPGDQVSVGANGYCSKTCSDASECGPGWTCEARGDSAVVCRCHPQAEVCDGIDNDCNGAVDEGCVGGAPCQADLRNDINNCGACGNRCADGQSCNQGTCECLAGDSLICGGFRCASLASDAKNCGVCGRACASNEYCHAGECDCVQGGRGRGVGIVHCNGQCVAPSQDESNCGTCGHACAPGQHCFRGDCAN